MTKQHIIARNSSNNQNENIFVAEITFDLKFEVIYLQDVILFLISEKCSFQKTWTQVLTFQFLIQLFLLSRLLICWCLDLPPLQTYQSERFPLTFQANPKTRKRKFCFCLRSRKSYRSPKICSQSLFKAKHFRSKERQGEPCKWAGRYEKPESPEHLETWKCFWILEFNLRCNVSIVRRATFPQNSEGKNSIKFRTKEAFPNWKSRHSWRDFCKVWPTCMKTESCIEIWNPKTLCSEIRIQWIL